MQPFLSTTLAPWKSNIRKVFSGSIAARWHTTMRWDVAPGLYWILVGSSSQDIELRRPLVNLFPSSLSVFSSGSGPAISAMVAASLAQTSENARAVYPALTNLPFIFPLLGGVCVGMLAGFINGTLIARTGIPPFIATLGMMVAARGFARAYTGGQPSSMLSPNFTWIGSGYTPVIIFLVTAVIFHIALRYTRYGKFTYAIGANPQAARVSGINVGRHLIIVYTIAGLLSGARWSRFYRGSRVDRSGRHGLGL